MCSVFDVDDEAGFERFLDEYGVEHQEEMIFGRRRRPTTKVSIVTGRHGAHQVENAIWHLYLEKQGDAWKPHKKYWSINSNWKKLGQRPEYRKSRCLIPATAWVESQHGKNPVEFRFGRPFFFCGLYKTWGDLLSCSIITLAAHPDTARFHEKSFPMIAPAAPAFVDQWLDGGEDTQAFEPYLHPDIRFDGADLLVQPLHKAMGLEYTGEAQQVNQFIPPGTSQTLF
ncbi:SOS response-associated peptidase family protein [Microbulbifer agarilyticus]|uniref:SOS response-associated peptidase family protein n=1 Tax=Microbulbifer agarilyticus TaxID=260552 RepID=UPI001CD2D94D|nr:SOS response-associated peptidase family protein [Microbulbifer agarilyticus]MCA0894361.1 SOS response-associated peptidase [Microbulbifer agarilyticus]